MELHLLFSFKPQTQLNIHHLRKRVFYKQISINI